MNARRLLAGSLLVLASTLAFGQGPDSLIAAVSERLVIGEGLQGSFQQNKYLSFLQEPFSSSGDFSIDRRTGLRWQVRQPLDSLMQVQGATVLLDGQPVDDKGVGQLMALIMFGLMEGQLDTLGKYFEISGQVTAGDWRLELLPRSARLQQVLTHIELRGEEHLGEIEIFEQGDNRTHIQLSEVQSYGESAPER
ncbi:MAG: outer membrane lipoprotein carrier protein LolA [Halieaceae bacterium]|nr:outer membrane lipoprotein carrier protein LolA [Halieaceae bacterium]